MLMTDTELSRRRVFGVGIAVSGLVLLALALIMGLEFPQYVAEENIQDLCILDTEHVKYNIWVQDSYRDRKNRLYYWQITNKDDFLYNGAFPQFVERGPYIYKEKQVKESIDLLGYWDPNHVTSFYEWKRQVYDSVQTQIECGEECKENDEITVLNEQYFKEMSAYGSDTYLAWNRLPAVLQNCYRDLRTSMDSNPTVIYQSLGVIQHNSENNPFIIDLSLDISAIDSSSSCTGFIPFGEWVAMNDTTSKRQVNDVINGDFQAKEMSGIYSVLMSPMLLGSTKDKLTDSSSTINQVFCDNSIVDGFQLSDYINLDENIIYDGTTGLYVIDGDDINLPCGLIYWLEKYQELSALTSSISTSESTLLNVSHIIQQYLCINNTNSSDCCLQFPADANDQMVYTSVIVEYVYTHLLSFSMQKSVILYNEEIVSTKTQKQLALGYYKIVNMNETEFVPGILENVLEEDVLGESHKVTLLNCNEQFNAQSNFVWHAYENLKYAKESQFPNTTQQERRVNGIRENYPPLLNLSACNDNNVLYDNFSVFLPRFWKTMIYERQGEGKVEGVRVNSYVLNQSNLHTDGKFVFEEGLQDMSGTNGYMSWASLPHYLYSFDNFTSRFNSMQPQGSLHLPNISIEPIAGNVWEKSNKYQHSVGISESYLLVDRFTSLEINTTNTPLPVYWVDEYFEYNSEGAKDHYNRVGELMAASCGGLISFSILSILVVLLGVSVAACQWKTTKIEPTPLEPESRNGRLGVKW